MNVCPSCGGQVIRDRCQSCGAVLASGRWRPGKGIVGMPGPKKENYRECKQCSEAAGDPVVYHTSALVREEADLFDDTIRLKCPKGHVLGEEAPKK